MAKLNIAQQKQAAKTPYRQLVQDSARGKEVDSDSVQQTLLLAGKSWDDLERDIAALETAIAEEAALLAKGYEAHIARCDELRAAGAILRKELEAEQADFNVRWKQMRETEEAGMRGSSLRNVVNSEHSELLASRKKLLGTTDLTAFPPIS